jgi:hypothetical protein
MSIDQAQLAVLKRKQAALVAAGLADEAGEVDDEIAQLRGDDGTARKVRKRAADAETATDAAVSDDAVVEKTTPRRR